MVVFEDAEKLIEKLGGENLRQELFLPYDGDMFYNARRIVNGYGAAFALDGEGNILKGFRWQASEYQHEYKYTGFIDTWFIDEYDTIFLKDCNEYSFELCRTALKLWKGSRLVFIGSSWEGMFELLDDLPGKECFYMPEYDPEEFDSYSRGRKYLYLLYGVYDGEDTRRCRQNIYFYDEVMTLLFLFANMEKKEGPVPEERVAYIDTYYDKPGLFAVLIQTSRIASYVKGRGFTPVLRITRSDKTFYSDFHGDDIYGKFFNQPEGIEPEQALEMGEVYHTTVFYHWGILAYLESSRKELFPALSWPEGIYCQELKAYIEKREGLFLREPEKTLGVLARGTDYAKGRLINHSIHATKEMLCEKIDETLEKNKELEYIYLATEDEDYCRYFKERYGDKISFTDQQRFSTAEGEILADYHMKNTRKSPGNGFRLGAEYAASIYLLSKCKSLIASGGCCGLSKAVEDNGGKYSEVYVFDLGVNR